MKEYINKDVADFFHENASDFEKAPPENVWENIREAIPSNTDLSHFQSFVKNIHMFPVLIGGVVVVAMMYFIKPVLETEKVNVISVNEQVVIEKSKVIDKKQTVELVVEDVNKTIEDVKEIIVVENNIEVKEIKQILKEDKLNTIIVSKSVPVKNDTTLTSSKHILISDLEEDDIVNVNKRIYNISATSFESIEKIQFVNNNKDQELIKEIISPSLSQYGYYAIDITDLKAGTYKVKVLTEGNWVDHKIETFN